MGINAFPQKEGKQHVRRDTTTGYDISGCGAEFSAPMGTFELIARQGYDWFALIGAKQFDGGGSGTSESAMIPKKKLQQALDKLRKHRPKAPDTSPTAIARMVAGPFARITYGGPSDPFEHYKPILDEFMNACIAWCDAHGTDEAEICFA